jgi:hypothetical protein
MTQPGREEELIRLMAEAALREVLEQYSDLQIWWVIAHSNPRNGLHRREAEYLDLFPDRARSELIENLASELASDSDRLKNVAGRDKYVREEDLVAVAMIRGIPEDRAVRLHNGSMHHSNLLLPTTEELNWQVGERLERAQAQSPQPLSPFGQPQSPQVPQEWNTQAQPQQSLQLAQGAMPEYPYYMPEESALVVNSEDFARAASHNYDFKQQCENWATSLRNIYSENPEQGAAVLAQWAAAFVWEGNELLSPDQAKKRETIWVDALHKAVPQAHDSYVCALTQAKKDYANFRMSQQASSSAPRRTGAATPLGPTSSSAASADGPARTAGPNTGPSR